jgi:predicted dehydrogenase
MLGSADFVGWTANDGIYEEEKGWKLDPKNKGVLLDMAVHYFMTIQWIVGEIEKVCAMAESVVVEKGKS